MRKILFYLFLFVYFFSTTNKVVAENRDKSINVVFVGNSITQGATIRDKEHDAAPAKCKDAFIEMTGFNVEMRNCGRSGMTTFNFLPGGRLFAEVVRAGKELQDNDKPLVFSIMLGTNDSAEKGPTGSPVDAYTYYTNMKTIVDSLFLQFPDAFFLINYPIWYSPSVWNSAEYGQKGLDRLHSYYPYISQLVHNYSDSHPRHVFCGNRKVYRIFAKRYKEFFTEEQGRVGVFWLHPNIKGAEVLGKIWAKSIRKNLKSITKNK